MTSNRYARGHAEREQHKAAKQAQPPPSLDHLVEVVRSVGGDETAEIFRTLNEPHLATDQEQPE